MNEYPCKIDVFAALVLVPLSRRTNRVGDGPQERGQAPCRNDLLRFQANFSAEPVPFLARVFTVSNLFDAANLVVGFCQDHG